MKLNVFGSDWSNIDILNYGIRVFRKGFHAKEDIAIDNKTKNYILRIFTVTKYSKHMM